jgi:uncharacterized protein (DUF952 family)
MEPIVHICTKNEWKTALSTGSYHPESLDREGFVHFSRPEQVLKVANTFFRGGEDLILLWIDPVMLSEKLKWENSDGDIFPHYYGSLQIDTVIAVIDLVPDEDGFFYKLPKEG